MKAPKYNHCKGCKHINAYRYPCFLCKDGSKREESKKTFDFKH